MTTDTYTFDELVEFLRERLGVADALNVSELHSFKELMGDLREQIPTQWYWEAFDQLEGQGHLDRVSMKLNGLDACGRLSADGRLYLRSL